MKKLLSLMCSFLMIVTLCGCSSTQDQQEEVTLTFAAAASLENTFEDKAGCGFTFGNGCSEGSTEVSLFGGSKKRTIPIKMEV